jgi:hypothetical protein
LISFIPSPKSQVISAKAVRSKFPTVCPDTDDSFSKRYSKSFLSISDSLLNANIALLISHGGNTPNSSLSNPVLHPLSLIVTIAAKL